MELIINSPSADGFIKAIEWNHEEIKAEITEKVAFYNGLVYDDNQIKEAKADRAELNKFKKALDDKRKEIKQQCLAPYESFEKQMKEILAIIEEPVKVIDAQVKAFEEKQKAEKEASIKEYFATKEFHGFTYEEIADAKWLNASTSMKAITEAIDQKADNIVADIEIINTLPEYTFEAMETYKRTQDIRAALAEAKRLTELATQKAEWEAKKAEEARLAEEAAKEAEAEAESEAEEFSATIEPIVEEIEALPFAEEPEELPFADDNFIPDFDSIKSTRSWVAIKAYMTPEDVEILKWCLEGRGVTFEILGE